MAVLLGRTSAGTSASFFSASEAASWKFVAAASGNVATLWWNPKVASTTLSTLELGIYSYAGAANTPNSKLGSAFVSGAVNGSGTVFATLGSPVAVVLGTTYCLTVVGTGDSIDFQGDSGANTFDYKSAAAPLPSSWGSSTGTDGDASAIIWGEDAGAAQVNTQAFNPIPFMGR